MDQGRRHSGLDQRHVAVSGQRFGHSNLRQIAHCAELPGSTVQSMSRVQIREIQGVISKHDQSRVLGHDATKPVNFFFCIVVVHGRPDDRRQISATQVEAGG